MIISNKHGIYAKQVAEQIKTQDLRKLEISGNLKTSRKYNLVTSLPPKMKILSMLAKNC